MIQNPITGIDLLITRGPNIDAIVHAIETIAEIDRAALRLPDEPDEKILSLLEHSSWGAIDAYAAGDFGFKVALYGRAPRDYHAIARQLAKHLNVLVAWPDERTLATTAFIACEADGTEHNVVCDDCEPDGFLLQRLIPTLVSRDVDRAFEDALWLQPHSAMERSELYVRPLNNELDFDLRAIDDAILDAVRGLGLRGIPMNRADLRINLRPYYPRLLPTLFRRVVGHSVTAPDLYFDQIAYAIWSAVPAAFQTKTEGTIT